MKFLYYESSAFVLIFGLISLFFLIIGLRGIITKKPFLISSRWNLALFILCFSPSLISSFYLSKIANASSGNLASGGWMMYIVLIVFVFMVKQGSYVAFGITDSSLRDALLFVLKRMNITYEETLGNIKLPALSAEIQVSIQSWIGTGQIRVRGGNDKALLTNIVRGMNEYYQATDTKINMTICYFYIIIAIMMMVPGFYLTSRVQSLKDHYSMAPKDISKFKIPPQITNDHALEAYKTSYLQYNDHKAFAYSLDGPYGYCTNMPDQDSAKDCAMKFCIKYSKSGEALCKILSVE